MNSCSLGDSDYIRIRPLSYPQTDVFLVCFSVGTPASFVNVKEKWYPEAHHFCPGVPCVVAATQIDLRDDSESQAQAVVEGDSEKMKKMQQRPATITTAQGEKLARKLKAAGYVECSAKTREGVEKAFDAVRRFPTFLFASADFSSGYRRCGQVSAVPCR